MTPGSPVIMEDLFTNSCFGFFFLQGGTLDKCIIHKGHGSQELEF